MQIDKKNFWSNFSSWEEAEQAWDEGAKQFQKIASLKAGSVAVAIPYIDPKLSGLSMKLKGLAWVVRKDRDRILLRNLLKNPIKYFLRYFWSLFGKGSYFQNGDFFLFNIKSFSNFCESLDPDRAVLIVGFSYCQKPFECPFGRFSSQCEADAASPICRQCMIGKAMNALPRSDNTISVIIPTVNDIGGVVLDAIGKYKGKKILFLISSCHMALSMFADLAYMVGIQGIGCRVQGRFCNTFKAFHLSEQGIKPGRTELSQDVSRNFFEILKIWRLRNQRS